MKKSKEINISEAFGATEGRDQRFAIYVPNKDKHGKHVDQEKWINKALILLSEICGGATVMPPVRGAWLNQENKELVIEEPVLVYTFIDPYNFAQRIDEIKDLVHEIGKKTRQGQMAFEFNQTFYLIDIEK